MKTTAQTEAQKQYQARDEARLRDSALITIEYAIEQAQRCAASSYGEEAGERVRHSIELLIGIK